MCLLTPYVLKSVVIDSAGNFPIKVCADAARHIGRLIHNYNQLHKGGQLLDFLTFFKTAALAFMEIYNAKIPITNVRS